MISFCSLHCVYRSSCRFSTCISLFQSYKCTGKGNEEGLSDSSHYSNNVPHIQAQYCGVVLNFPLQVGARGVIVIDNRPSSTSARDKLFYMSGDSPDGKPPEEHLQLPFVFLYHEEGQTLTNAMERRWMSEKKPVVVMIAKREDSPSMGIEFSILLDRLLKMMSFLRIY